MKNVMSCQILRILATIALPRSLSALREGGGQNLERRNVKRLIFRNFEITNIKMKKNELFDPFIFELFLYFLETI